MCASVLSAPMETISRHDVQQLNFKKEILSIEKELKDWFLTRRFTMERHIGIKKMLDKNNFIGFSMNNPDTPDAERVMWRDLVLGKPELENSLSLDAREMKAQMYMKMFKRSTDIENPCRLPGVKYLRCIEENFKETEKNRSSVCLHTFSSFDACRKSLLKKQETAFENALIKQQLEDNRAKTLFERRTVLLDMLTGNTTQQQ